MYRLLGSAAEGCPGHGPAYLLVESAAEIGFQWDSRLLGWERLGLPVLSNLAGPVQHFRAAILEAWRYVSGRDFVEGPWLDIDGGERDKALLKGCPCWWGLEWLSVWEGPGSACAMLVLPVVLMVMVIFSGIVLFLPWLRSVNILKFMVLWRWISLFGLGAFFGMDGCLCSRG